jgi:hypothetical protein
MASTNAGLTIGTVSATGAVTGNAAGPIGFTQITGSSIALATTSGGIGGQRLFATGVTSLAAPGTIAVSDDLRTSSATVSGGSVAIASTRDLLFASLTATNGDATIATTGSLTVANAIARNGGINLAAQGALTFNIGRATGDSSFTAGGALQVTSFTTTGNLALRGTTIGAFTALAGRDVSLVATTGALTGQQLAGSGIVTLTTPDVIAFSAISAAGGVIASGSQISLTSPDALNVARFTTTQGDANFQAANLLTVSAGSSAGALAMASTNAGLTIGTVSATGAVTGNAAGPIGFTQIAGSSIALATTSGGIGGQRLFATGVTSLTAPGTIAVSDDLRTSSAAVSGGSVAIASTRDLLFASLTATNGDATIATTGSLTVANGSSSGAGNFLTSGALALNTFTSGTDLILTAATLPSFTRLSGRNISLTLLSGDLTGGTLIASGTTTLATPGTLAIADLRSAGAVTLSGATVDIGSTGALNVARATAGDGGLKLRSAGALTVASATSSAGVDLASTGGSATVGTITMTGTPPGIVRDAVAGTSPLTIASAGTTTLDGDITGAGAAAISGTGLVLNGLIDASGISLASQTIAVGPAALIGTLARTGTVAFTNTGTGRSVIGGSGSATGYSLDANALSRIQASSVTLSLPQTATSSVATPDVVIDGFTLYGTGAAAPAGSRQNLGTGSLAIATTGQVQVNGAIRLANLASNGSGGLTIRAAGIDVVTPAGSIVQTNAAGAPGGTLDLDARVVRVHPHRARKPARADGRQ